ncbi:MAG: hypothetical protein ACOH1I_00410 [Gallionellaceae bacterium]
MTQHLLTVIIVLVTILSGCATKTIGPLVAGKNIWIISREEGIFPTGNKPLLKEALEEATTFCKNLDKDLKLINTEEHRQIIGAFPKATVTYTCVDSANK